MSTPFFSFYGSAKRVGDESTDVWNLLGSLHCTLLLLPCEGAQLSSVYPQLPPG